MSNARCGRERGEDAAALELSMGPLGQPWSERQSIDSQARWRPLPESIPLEKEATGGS